MLRTLAPRHRPRLATTRASPPPSVRTGNGLSSRWPRQHRAIPHECRFHAAGTDMNAAFMSYEESAGPGSRGHGSAREALRYHRHHRRRIPMSRPVHDQNKLSGIALERVAIDPLRTSGCGGPRPPASAVSRLIRFGHDQRRQIRHSACCAPAIGCPAALDSPESASPADRGTRPGHETGKYRPLSVVLAVRDFLALFEHVFFGLVVGNFCGRRGLLAILGVMVGVLVVGVLVLGVAIGAGCHGCESCLPVPGTQPRGTQVKQAPCLHRYYSAKSQVLRGWRGP